MPNDDFRCFVMLADDVAIASTAVLTLALEDASIADAPAQPVVTVCKLVEDLPKRLNCLGPVAVDGAILNPARTYVLRAHISQAGIAPVVVGDLVSTRSHPVPAGLRADICIDVQRVGGE